MRFLKAQKATTERQTELIPAPGISPRDAPSCKKYTTYTNTILCSAYIPTGFELNLNLKVTFTGIIEKRENVEKKKEIFILHFFNSPSLQLMEKNRRQGKLMRISSGQVHEHVNYSGRVQWIGERGENTERREDKEGKCASFMKTTEWWGWRVTI